MIDPADIRVARARIAGLIRHTDCDRSDSLSHALGQPVWLKLDSRQPTGAFKLRGASNAVAQIDPAACAGVTAASTGNHGRALAHAARAAGIRAVICMSRLVPANKVRAIEALGAEARIIGASQDEAEVEATRLVREEGFEMVPPFDDARIIAGQGTLGLEILEDVPDLATVAVPLSGGGLIGGVALAIKSTRPDVRIVALSGTRGPAMKASLEAGRPIQVEELPSLADSLGGGIGLDNRHTFEMVRDLVDEVIAVPEAEIAEGIRHAYREEREIVEGAGAIGIGAILSGRLTSDGPLVLPVTGRNIDMTLHARIAGGENIDLMEEEMREPCPT